MSSGLQVCAVLMMIVCLANAEKPPQMDDDQSVSLKERLPELNRYTFHNSVLRNFGAYDIKEWVVVFCPRWFGPCESMKPQFITLANQWEEKLNVGLLSSVVRFAYVDCATEKALCNEQGVEDYPTINHYHEYNLTSQFSTHSQTKFLKQFTSWLEQELKEARDTYANDKTGEDLLTGSDAAPSIGLFTSLWPEDPDSRAATTDMMVILSIIVGNAFLIARNFDRVPKFAQSTSEHKSGAMSHHVSGEAARGNSLTQSHERQTITAQAEPQSRAQVLQSIWAQDLGTIEI